MKRILVLILLFSLFSCDKDEPQMLGTSRSEKEIFNALIGTWHFSRLAHDPNFKKIQEIPYHECTEKYHVNFRKDSTMSAVRGCVEGDMERGLFYVQIGGNSANDTRVHIKFYSISIWLSPNIKSAGGAGLHHYTDSTLIFEGVSYEVNGKSIPNLYSEFKRVK